VTRTQENALIASVLNWIKEHKLPGNHHGTEITEDIDLITDGLLDSMGLVDLLLFVEEQTGQPIDLKTVEPADICVVKNLCRIALGNDISQSTGECEHGEPSCRDLFATGRKV
jgi:acyl carrier protein